MINIFFLSVTLSNTILPIFLGSQESIEVGITNVQITNKISRGFLIFPWKTLIFAHSVFFLNILTTKIVWEIIGYIFLTFKLSKTCLF